MLVRWLHTYVFWRMFRLWLSITVFSIIYISVMVGFLFQLSELRSSNRNLRIRVKNLVNELAVMKRGYVCGNCGISRLPTASFSFFLSFGFLFQWEIVDPCCFLLLFVVLIVLLLFFAGKACRLLISYVIGRHRSSAGRLQPKGIAECQVQREAPVLAADRPAVHRMSSQVHPTPVSSV